MRRMRSEGALRMKTGFSLCLMILCMILASGCSPFPRTGIRLVEAHNETILANKTIGVYFYGVGSLQSLDKAGQFRDGGFLIKSDIDSIPARFVAKLRAKSTFTEVVQIPQAAAVDTMIRFHDYQDIEFCIPHATTDLIMSMDSIVVYHNLRIINLKCRFIIWDNKARRMIATGRINTETSGNFMNLILHEEAWTAPGLLDMAINDAVESILEDSPFQKQTP